MNAALRGIAGHGAEVFVHQGFPADEKQVANVVLDANVDHVARLLQGHAAAHLGIETIKGEAEKVTLGIKNVSDSKLKIAWSAVVEHLTEQFKNRGLGPNDRLGKINDRSRRSWRRFRSWQHRDAHA